MKLLKAIKAWWKGLNPKVRWTISTVLKVGVTVLAFYALLTHKIRVDKESDPVTIISAITTYLPTVDARTFWTFCIIAGAVKFVGVLCSAFSWHLLLVGQRIKFPFWRHIVTTFLIGRFIGTFLPSTLGLDGYTLYDAGRYSNQWERVTMAKALEKFIGITGLFLGMLILMPFGIHIFEGNAMMAGLIIGSVAGSVVLAVFLGVFFPTLLQKLMSLALKLTPGFIRNKIETQAERLIEAAGAYKGRTGLLITTFVAKFMVHFTTAIVYVFTAYAVGVATVDFGAVTFASTIQILGTVLSPTIAGEGAREAIQAFLLSGQMTTVQAVLSAALGFIAAEAATLWGGAFWWGRRGNFRPVYCTVDDQQVDYEHLNAKAEQSESSVGLQDGPLGASQ